MPCFDLVQQALLLPQRFSSRRRRNVVYSNVVACFVFVENCVFSSLVAPGFDVSMCTNKSLLP